MVKKTVNDYIHKHTYDNIFTLHIKRHKFIPDHDMSIDMFVKNFLLAYRNVYSTDRNGDPYYCTCYRRRSLTDIYGLCKNYYPNCTIDEVVMILIKLLDEKIIVGSYCTTTHLFVFHDDSLFYNPNDKTEYGDNILWIDVVNAYKNNKL